METHPTAKAGKILVADDDEGMRYLMVEVLERDGFETHGVESGKEALHWLLDEHPDLLLLDLKLGDLPAPQLVEALRKRGQEFPFVIVTGHGDERTAVEMMKQGALDYVMKEAGMLEFLPSVARRAMAVVHRERQLADANAALRHREERLRKIIQTGLDGFVQCDADWRIVETNDALCELLAYKCPELRGTNLAQLEAGVTSDQAAARLQQLLAAGSARWFTRLKKKDGNSIEVEISMRADAGEYFGFIHDLSHQRQLERQILQITEDERRRFGHELHDSLGQQLTAIELMSHTLARELKSRAVKLSKSAYEIAEFTRKTIAQTRQLAHGLAPVALEANGLTTALNDLATVTKSAGVECEFQSELTSSVDDLAIATHLFRVAQEAVNNALRHAGAKRITIRLSETPQAIELSIADDGRGFSPKEKRKRGMGLDVMHHRARLIAAQIAVNTTRGKGTEVHCVLPKNP